jgi:uncharacterized protein YndB with AHSA1/START domain
MTTKRWEITWEGELPASPQAVWDTITRRAGSYLWPIEYEPRVGGTERGLTQGGGTVTAWDPHRHFATRSRPEAERDGLNAVEFTLEPLGAVTYLRYTHRAEIPAAEYDLQLAMCRAHTAFYQHSLGQAACHFAGLKAEYAADDEVEGSFADVTARLGVPADAHVGDRVRITPHDTAPIEGVIDYRTPHFLGVRGRDVLYRVYGRDHWDYPVGTTVHRFPTRTEA